MKGKYEIVEQTFNPGLALIGLSGTEVLSPWEREEYVMNDDNDIVTINSTIWDTSRLLTRNLWETIHQQYQKPKLPVHFISITITKTD